jgi:16S rRNA (cytosine967-C5)-methyltransferase
MPIPSQRPKARRLRRPTKVTPARWAAWLVLRRTFEEDAWTDRAFGAVAEQLELDPRERAFAQRLAYGTVQQAKRLDHVIGVLGKRPLRKIDPPVLHALRIGIYELLELQQATGPDGERLGSSSAHAAVDQAVELVRGVVGERAVAFTNAILRRAQVDGANILDGLDASKDDELAILLSMPDWLVARARAAHGEQGIDALRAQNEPTPATFRDTTTGELLEVDGSTGHLADRVARGELVAQSRASQLVATALDPQPGERILDMCAAPGGKSTHLAALMGNEGEIVAVELHEHRADSIRELARRTHTDSIIDVRVADAPTLDPAELGTFDRVLLDAPCTGTGVLAARPDSRWKRSEESLAELVLLQEHLLQAAARMLRPGGVLVYSTCSILREEDEQLVAERPDDLEPDALPPNFAPLLLDGSTHAARTWPQRDGTDGFFIARFRRGEPVA